MLRAEFNANSRYLCSGSKGWVTAEEASLVPDRLLKNTVLKGRPASGAPSWSRPFVRVKISPRRNYKAFRDASLG